MPLRPTTLHIPPGCRAQFSIRDQLEADAWQHHPRFSAQLARRRPPG